MYDPDSVFLGCYASLVGGQHWLYLIQSVSFLLRTNRRLVLYSLRVVLNAKAVSTGLHLPFVVPFPSPLTPFLSLVANHVSGPLRHHVSQSIPSDCPEESTTHPDGASIVMQALKCQILWMPFAPECVRVFRAVRGFQIHDVLLSTLPHEPAEIIHRPCFSHTVLTL